MKTFEINFDQKVEIWSRCSFSIMANSKAEALELAKQQNEEAGPDNFEYLVDSEYPMTVAENGNQFTEEWQIDGKTVETNLDAATTIGIINHLEV